MGRRLFAVKQYEPYWLEELTPKHDILGFMGFKTFTGCICYSGVKQTLDYLKSLDWAFLNPQCKYIEQRADRLLLFLWSFLSGFLWLLLG